MNKNSMLTQHSGTTFEFCRQVARNCSPSGHLRQCKAIQARQRPLDLNFVTLFMEALPMIAPKNLAEGTEFLVTIAVSAVAGLAAFLLVALVVNMLGL